MDVNHIRIAAMLLGFVGFLWLVLWAWSRKRQDAFDEAARLPFTDPADTDSQGGHGGTR